MVGRKAVNDTAELNDLKYPLDKQKKEVTYIRNKLNLV